MYSAKVLRDNFKGSVDFFRQFIYPEPALQPEYPWLATNTSSIQNLAAEIQLFPNGRFYVVLDETNESCIMSQIAIYKLKATREWGLFKVYSLSGAVTDKNTGVELEKGHYIATLVDRFGREGMKTYFEISV